MNTELGYYYLLASAPLIFFSSNYFTRIFSFYHVPMLMSIFMWVFFFPRCFLLIGMPELFMYPNLDELSVEDHKWALTTFFVLSVIFLGSVSVALKGIDPDKIFKGTSKVGSLLIQKARWVLIGLIFMLLLKLGLQVIFGASTIGASTGLEFVSYILPLEFILPISMIFLIFYHSNLERVDKYLTIIIVLLSVASAVLHASKAAIINIVLFVFIAFVLKKGNFKMAVPKLLSLLVFVGIPLLLSVLIMQVLRSEMQMGIKVDLFTLVDLVGDNLGNDILMMNALNNFTKRLAVYDGLMVTYLADVPDVHKIFSLKNIWLSYIDKIVPFYTNDGVGLGGSVGYYYSNLPYGYKHAGAVGLYGSLRLITGKYVYLSLAVVGFALGYILNLVLKYNKDHAIRKIIFAVWVQIILIINASGNFDNHGQLITMTLGHLFFYYFGLQLLIKVKDWIKQA